MVPLFPRQYSGNFTLTSAYQFGTVSDFFTPYGNDGNPGGSAWRRVALWVSYVQGSASGSARVRVNWGSGNVQGGGLLQGIPAVGSEIDLPVGTGVYVLSVDAPALYAAEVGFEFKEVGDTANPGDIDDVIIVGEAWG